MRELPPKAEERLRQIEGWRDGLDGQRREIHEKRAQLNLTLQNLDAEKQTASADVVVEIDREIDRLRKKLAANGEAYAEIGRKGARINALKENLEKYLREHGFLLLHETPPRKSRGPILQRTAGHAQQNSVEQQRAERLREKGWR